MNAPEPLLMVGLRQLIESDYAGFGWCVDLAQRELTIDSAWLQLHGFATNSTPGLHFLNTLVHTDDLPPLVQKIESQRQADQPVFVIVVRLIDAHSRIKFYRFVGGVGDPSKAPALVHGVAVEETLCPVSAEPESIEAMLGVVPLAVLSTCEENTVRYANDLARDWLCGGAEPCGKPLQRVLDLDQCEQLEEKKADILNPPVGGGRKMARMRVRLPDTTLVNVECTTIPIRASDGSLCSRVLCFRDVTREVEVAQQIQHTARLSAIGHLAGGVAHDFNNMLAGVSGAAELIKIQAAEKLSVREIELLQLIVDRCQQAKDLSLKLSALGRRGFEQKAGIDMHALIQDVVHSFSLTLSGNIEVTVELAAMLTTVNGHQAALHSALLNTLVNARHAVGISGQISITTDDLSIAQNAGAEYELPAGNYFQLEIRDTGVGIPEPLQDRIFQPYFTTRVEGHGTGLGLAALRATVLDHGGDVSFYSVENVGTTFQILLPASQTPAVSPVTATDGASGGWRVLVVDDEESIRTLVKELLQTLGCVCDVASDGAMAIDLFSQSPRRYDVVLMDMIMPGLDGAETFSQLHAMRSDCPVVIMSGYLPADSEQRLVHAGVAGFLSKPFSRLQLQQTIAKALAAQQALGDEQGCQLVDV